MNGSPIELLEPEILKFKVYEPVLLLGQDRFSNVDIRIRVKGGGRCHVSACRVEKGPDREEGG